MLTEFKYIKKNVNCFKVFSNSKKIVILNCEKTLSDVDQQTLPH